MIVFFKSSSTQWFFVLVCVYVSQDGATEQHDAFQGVNFNNFPRTNGINWWSKTHMYISDRPGVQHLKASREIIRIYLQAKAQMCSEGLVKSLRGSEDRTTDHI